MLVEARNAYLKAGRIASEVLKRSRSYVEEEAYIFEICEKVEKDIARLGGLPAFPCNISQNDEAAHYTAAPDDDKKVKAGSMVKVDIGVQVDGYIADIAITIGFSYRWMGMIQAAKDILDHAIGEIRAGLGFSSFGSSVEERAKGLGYQTIENLAGHKLGPYLLHAGESIPNRRVVSMGVFKKDEAYAIEPFIVERGAKGYVINKGVSNIYRLANPKKVKDKRLKELMIHIWNKYKGLPFASRWIFKSLGHRGLEGLQELVKLKIVHSYPILVEAGGFPVAQFEHTVLVEENGILITTKP